MNPLLCTVCNVQCDTAANYHAHVLSKKHMYKLEAARAPTHDLFCVHCQKHTDNRANFIAHNASKAHLSRLAELGIPTTTQPATPTTPRIVVVDMTIDDDDDDWFIDQPALVIDTPPVVQPLSTPRPPVTPALSIWATPPAVTHTTALVTATLPVVESPAVKPRSVQVAALPSPAVFATKKAPVVAATLPVVESPTVKPRSVQVVALPKRAYSSVVSGVHPTGIQNFNERLATWGILPPSPHLTIDLSSVATTSTSPKVVA